METRIFLSYAPGDKALKEELRAHLAVLEQRETIRIWSVASLLPGDDAEAEARKNLEAAHVVVLLVSADFLGSARCAGEVRAALSMRKRVVPVYLRPCFWETASFAQLAALPANGEPVTLWQVRDAAWREIVLGLAAVVEAIAKGNAADLEERSEQPRIERTTSEIDRWLCEIEGARAERDAHRRAGTDASAAQARMMDLRRKLRDGGRLRENDSLGDGRYFLLQALGRGGFATVWDAEDRAAGARVAVKVLHPQLAVEPTRRERFFRGAEKMASLDHDNVVRVLVPKEEDTGFFYFVMELVRGSDLRRAVLGKRISGRDVIPLVLKVGSALQTAHDAGLVHRDIKPANILVGTDGEPKLTDFDLVLANDTTGGTRTGVMGSFVYAAPEVLSRPQDADPRADVFGLAMTAIFGLYGEDLPSIVLRRPEPLVAKIANEAVARVLLGGIEWDVAERYPTVRAFCDALRAAYEAPSRPSPAPPAPPRSAPPPAGPVVRDRQSGEAPSFADRATPPAGSARITRTSSSFIKTLATGPLLRPSASYQIIAELGQGSIAKVSLGIARGSAGAHWLVAIKEIREHLADDSDFLLMLLDEARIASRLNHPNVVRTIEVCKEAKRYFICMEYVAGQPLSRVLQRIGRDRIPVGLQLRILCEVLSGLHHAHELADDSGTPLQVVHRDVSPQNVFVTYAGEVKVFDFGIAKSVGQSVETKPGVLKGNMFYIAPEQARGERVDRRADVFSVGVMMWEALAGRRMFPGSPDIEVLQRIVSGPLPSPGSTGVEVDPWLDAVCMKALAHDREHRYETALDLRMAIELALDASGDRSKLAEAGPQITLAFAAESARIAAAIESSLSSGSQELLPILQHSADD